ncbi:tyrosinase family protein [Nitrospirillum pindoramense]|uniref:Tyrosinase n=1 Tax=Nitrospirillum amazonense TaxID=28077 RepID=A0A560H4D2_9PROT|nr:tyrosinase family protein [Nitrospirillum amazonense]TWB40480.1 tyrosinase [Nitrospirillum amazonense]
MVNITRRATLLGSAALAASSTLPALPAFGAPYVRSDVATPEGQRMLAIYAQGVKLMKQRPVTDPLSWNFQWFIHASPRGKAKEISDAFGSTQSPARQLAEAAWDTCQAHGGRPVEFFLPWHRLYVLCLESIIRTVTKQPGFALPYWNYTDPRYYAIPVQFQNAYRNDALFGTLFQQNRNVNDPKNGYADVNAGAPINKYFPGSRNFLNLNNMNVPYYGNNRTGFNAELNSQLHGSVHVYVGDQTNMGNVPTAAEDPIFWLHHCNIDRILAGWNAAGGVTPSWPGKTFTFAGPQGQSVTLAIDNYRTNSQLPYSYDVLPVPPNGPFGAQAVASAEASTATAKVQNVALLQTSQPTPNATAPVTLGAQAQKVELQPTTPQNTLSNTLKTQKSLRAAAPQRLLLVLHGLHAKIHPGITYQVYLNLPEGAKPEASDANYVGIVTFFDAVDMPGHADHGGVDKVFDITDLAAKLEAEGKNPEKATVSLVPTGTPAQGSDPVITGGIELRSE